MSKPRTDDRRSNEPRVDRRIRVPEVLVIDDDGQKLGVMPTSDALRRAQEKNLNLVEVAPNVRPPVCKILDYGKYKYDLKQDAKRKKKKQVQIEVKEIKFRPKVDKHDFEFKIRHCDRFMREGNKVRCTVMFRGRELAHPQIGEDVLKRVLAVFEGKVVIESPPRMEGRTMGMQLAPKPGAFPKPEKSAAALAAEEDEDIDDSDVNPEDEELSGDIESDLDVKDEDGEVTASV